MLWSFVDARKQLKLSVFAWKRLGILNYLKVLWRIWGVLKNWRFGGIWIWKFKGTIWFFFIGLWGSILVGMAVWRKREGVWWKECVWLSPHEELMGGIFREVFGRENICEIQNKEKLMMGQGLGKRRRVWLSQKCRKSTRGRLKDALKSSGAQKRLECSSVAKSLTWALRNGHECSSTQVWSVNGQVWLECSSLAAQ